MKGALTLCDNVNMSDDSMKLKILRNSSSFICFVKSDNILGFFYDFLFLMKPLMFMVLSNVFSIS